MERGREGPTCSPGELQEGGPRDGTPESTEDEEGGAGALCNALESTFFFLEGLSRPGERDPSRDAM